MSRFLFRHPGRRVAPLFLAVVLFPAMPSAAPSLAPRGSSKATPVRCDGAVQHPIQVRAIALDPVRRGEVVRVRVITSSRVALERGDVALVSTGGAERVGAARASFARLIPGTTATTEFAVRLPAQGSRFLLQFRVRGDGGSGLEERGATLNLLPDGPADAGRVVTSDGGQRIVEHGARRLP